MFALKFKVLLELYSPKTQTERWHMVSSSFCFIYKLVCEISIYLILNPKNLPLNRNTSKTGQAKDPSYNIVLGGKKSGGTEEREH